MAAIQWHFCQTAIGMLPESLKIAGQDVQVSGATADFRAQIEAGIEASIAWALETAVSGVLDADGEVWRRWSQQLPSAEHALGAGTTACVVARFPIGVFREGAAHPPP